MWMRECCRMLNRASGVQASHLPTQMENGLSVGISRFSDPQRPDTKDVIFGAGELGIQVNMITGDNVAIGKETCRLIGIGTKIPTTKDIPANEADTLLHSPFQNFAFLIFPIIFCSRCTGTHALRNSCWFDSVHRHTVMPMRTHF